jgi:hypothetical protein
MSLGGALNTSRQNLARTLEVSKFETLVRESSTILRYNEQKFIKSDTTINCRNGGSRISTAQCCSIGANNTHRYPNSVLGTFLPSFTSPPTRAPYSAQSTIPAQMDTITDLYTLHYFAEATSSSDHIGSSPATAVRSSGRASGDAQV